MSGHAELLKVVQEIANDCYHADRAGVGYEYNPKFDYHVNQIAMRLHEPLAAILREIGLQLERLGQLETEHKDATAAEHMRGLTWFAAAAEIAMYIEGNFTFEPIETRVPDETPATSRQLKDLSRAYVDGPQTETAQEIFDAVVRMRDAGQPHPDYVFEYDRGILRGVSKRAQKLSAGSGHVRWAVGTDTPENALIRERAEFGERVRAERKAHKVKRKCLASWIGVPKETIRMLERGELTHFGGGTVTRNNYIVAQVVNGLSSTVDILWPEAAGNEENK